MSTNENNDMEVADSEHVDTKSTDVESSNQDNTADAKSGDVKTANSNDSKSTEDELIDANSNKEEGEEPISGDVIESGKDEDGAASKPKTPAIDNITETGKHGVTGAAKTSETQFSAATQTTGPSISDVSSQTRSLILVDTAAQTSPPPSPDASEKIEISDKSVSLAPSEGNDSKQDKSPKSDATSSEGKFQSESQVQPESVAIPESLSATQPKSTLGDQPISVSVTKPDEDKYYIIYKERNNEIRYIDLEAMDEDLIIPLYLRSITCKNILCDTEIVPVVSPDVTAKDACKTAVGRGRKGIPIWTSSIPAFIGMFTPTDIVKVLSYYYHVMPAQMKYMENQTVEAWRQITDTVDRFVCVEESESFLKATKLLIEERVHRLPVMDETHKVVFTNLTKKRILRYMVENFFDQAFIDTTTPSFLFKTIGELKIGTYEDIVTINRNARLIDALDLFVTRNVSCLPVMDENNRVINSFDKNDFFELVKGNLQYNLNMTIYEAIPRIGVRVKAWPLTLDETLGRTIQICVNEGVHHFRVVKDDYATLIGIVSLSDLLKFLVVDPLVKPNLPFTLEPEGSGGGASKSPLKDASLAEQQKALMHCKRQYAPSRMAD